MFEVYILRKEVQKFLLLQMSHYRKLANPWQHRPILVGIQALFVACESLAMHAEQIWISSSGRHSVISCSVDRGLDNHCSTFIIDFILY